MLTTTVKTLLAAKRRLFTTALAVLLGVAFMAGTLVRTDTGYAQLVDKHGKALGNPNLGAAPVGADWGQVDALNPFNLVTGRPPQADDEVVIDKASADKARFAVGDTATVLVQTGPQRVQVTGIARFGTADSPAGSSVVLFTRAAAERLIGEP